MDKVLGHRRESRPGQRASQGAACRALLAAAREVGARLIGQGALGLDLEEGAIEGLGLWTAPGLAMRLHELFRREGQIDRALLLDALPGLDGRLGVACGGKQIATFQNLRNSLRLNRRRCCSRGASRNCDS